MSSPKPVAPEPKTYKVNNVVVTKKEYDAYKDEQAAMAEKCRQFERICQQQLRPYRRY